MSLADVVAQNLRAQRIRKKLSQKDLAKKVGVCISYISMLERGDRSPPLGTLETLASALGVTPLALLEKR